MPLPPWLARFNKVATNRVTRGAAGHLPGFAVITHHGRRSGRRYRTPVNAFARDGGFTIPLTYGPDADWVKNVLAAGGAELTTRGRAVRVTAPRTVRDAEHGATPRPVGAVLGLLNVDWFLEVDLVEPGGRGGT